MGIHAPGRGGFQVAAASGKGKLSLHTGVRHQIKSPECR